MTIYKFVNFFVTELTLGIDDSSTAMQIPQEASLLLPLELAEEEVVRLVLWDGQQDPELVDVLVNPGSGTLGIERAKEGSTAKDWAAGTQVQSIISAEILNAFMESFFNVDILLESNFLKLSGGSMSGHINLPGDPPEANSAARRSWVESLVSGFLSRSGGTMTGNIDMGGTQRILRLANPTVADHAATKAYADGVNSNILAQLNDDTGIITTGTNTAYVAASNRTGLSLSDGLTATFRFHTSNGKAPTLNFAGLGARAIQNHSGQSIEQGFIRAFIPMRATYQGSTNSWLIHSQGNDDGFPGDIKFSMITTDHGNWLLADGRTLSRTVYDRLFGTVGTKWGAGDGSTTFGLLDGRGRVLAGADNMGGGSANRITNAVSGFDGTVLGAAGGLQNHQLVTAELPAHTHVASVTDPTHAHTQSYRADVYQGLSSPGSGVGWGGSGSVSTAASATGITVSNANTGSDQAHRNVQPTSIVNIFVHI